MKLNVDQIVSMDDKQEAAQYISNMYVLGQNNASEVQRGWLRDMYPLQPKPFVRSKQYTLFTYFGPDLRRYGRSVRLKQALEYAWACCPGTIENIQKELKKLQNAALLLQAATIGNAAYSTPNTSRTSITPSTDPPVEQQQPTNDTATPTITAPSERLDITTVATSSTAASTDAAAGATRVPRPTSDDFMSAVLALQSTAPSRLQSSGSRTMRQKRPSSPETVIAETLSQPKRTRRNRSAEIQEQPKGSMQTPRTASVLKKDKDTADACSAPGKTMCTIS